MTTRTEQETRRGAPVRGVPTTGAKTGQRRPEPPHPAKPVPQPRTDTARRRADDDTPPRAGRPARADTTARRGASGARDRAPEGRDRVGVRERTRGAETAARPGRGAAAGEGRGPAAAPSGVRERARGTETDARASRGAGARSGSGAAGVRERAGKGGSATRTVTEPRRTRPGTRGTRPETGRPQEARQRRAAARPARRQRTPFVLLVVGLLCGGLVTLLLLNTVLAQDSMTASTLVDEISTARQQNEDLQRQLENEKLPDRVAERAEDLGLRRDWNEVNPYDSTSQAGPER